LRDPSDDPLGAGAQPFAVLSVPEERRHHLTARLAGEAVGDPLLEVVPDLDPDAPLLQREQDQEAVVLALLSNAFAVVREQLDGVLLDVAVGLDGRHGRDHDDVAGRGLQRADHPIDRARAVGVDDLGEVVDRSGQFRKGTGGRGLGARDPCERQCEGHRHGGEPRRMPKVEGRTANGERRTPNAERPTTND
jgi:hypothetical protein